MKILVFATLLLGIAHSSFLQSQQMLCGNKQIPNYKNICIQPNYIEGCQLYQTQSRCFKCFQAYQLDQGLCSINNLHSSIFEKIAGCIKYDVFLKSCLICANGFRKVKQTCLKGIRNCQFYNEDGSCKQCHHQFSLLLNQCRHNEIIGCKKEKQNHTCQQCYHPFYLQNGRCNIQHCKKIYDFGCTSCQCGYFLSSKRTCDKNKRGCLRYLRGYCTDCIWHFIMKGGECVIDGCLNYQNQICHTCAENYVKTVDGGCQFQNCFDWLDQQCLICKQGFTLQGKVCIPDISSNKV